MAYALQLLTEDASFLEALRWRDDRWYVSDFYLHTVSSITPDGEQAELARVEYQPSGLGFLPDGSLLIVSMTDRRILRLADGELSVHADLSAVAAGNLNDLVVDATGRAYVGHMGEGVLGLARPGFPPSFLIRVEPDGTTAIEAEGVRDPNGAVLTPDGRTLILGETIDHRYSAYTVQDDGSLTDRRIWAESADRPFTPDGCCLDAEGCLWVAAISEGRFLRVAEGGDIVDEIVLPDGRLAVSCMLGGDDGRTLALATVPRGATHFSERRDATLHTTVVDVPHAGLP